MRLSRTILVLCVVSVCPFAAFASDDSAPNRIANLESSLTAGTATHEEQLELAQMYAGVGRYYEAKKLASRLIVENPNDAAAIDLRDRATAQLDLIAKQRIDDAQAAAKREGSTEADRQELADAYFAAGRYSEALPIYGALSDPSYDVRLRQARALAWSGQHDEAERRYSKLLAEKSTPELELEYGRLLSWMGAERAAVTRLERAHQSANSEETAIALANAQTWSGNRAGAVVVLRDFTNSHPNAYEARAMLRDLEASPLIRIEKLDQQIADDDFNLALRVERARLYYDSGQYSRALKDIAFVRTHANGRDVPDLSDLERNAIAKQKEEIAKLDERRRLLYADGPMTSSSSDASSRASQVLDLAKGYTGLGANHQAAELYADYLTMMPSDTNARLNYARVLSWDRRYDESQRQYQMVLRDLPDRPDLRLEYAQTLEYGQDYVPALHEFTLLTDLSSSPRAELYPDVPARAHFHQGQIYRWYGWRDHAITEQNSALSMDSTFTDAHHELERARYGRPGTQLQARYTTETNSNDFSARLGDLEGEHWLNPRLAVQGAVGRHSFEQGGANADANVASAGAAFRRSEERRVGKECRSRWSPYH